MKRAERLLNLIERVKREGLKPKISAEFRLAYGDRYSRALDAVARDCVRRYLFEPSGKEIWIVEGKEASYFVIPYAYCDCDDFYLNVVIRGLIDACYHLIAQAIAEALGRYTTTRLPDDVYRRMMNEWLKL
ncbi:MAG: hypothetical protein DRN15_04595 [Thermoprotei archaeon]|nr:MAG: hypothetical protein DRN15_04595 [Thermoprotei archaeon]RLF25900.1 MAG: hypothetical protein DRM97_00235 [Thermoprotei archaeon]